MNLGTGSMADATQLLATQIRVLEARLEEARELQTENSAVSLALWPEKSDVDARNSNVCFNPMNRHHQLEQRRPKRATAQSRCAPARCAGSPTVSAVTGG
jgi:hypothetical protein